MRFIFAAAFCAFFAPGFAKYLEASGRQLKLLTDLLEKELQAGNAEPAEAKRQDACEGFTCGEGSCVDVTFQCDGIADCPDDTDESACVCTADQFACTSGNIKCLPMSFKCDKSTDCADASDESDCDASDLATGACVAGAESCDGGAMCYLPGWKCDDGRDCADGSDEAGCAACNAEQFFCPTGDRVCINIDWQCDGRADCGAGEDEADCTSASKRELRRSRAMQRSHTQKQKRFSQMMFARSMLVKKQKMTRSLKP